MENLKEFLKNQSETRNDPFGIDYFGQKATNLIEKYSQDHREKGELLLLLIPFVFN